MVLHGLRKHQLYNTWNGMIQRCRNENADSYKRYGGRGITICDRWIGENGLKNFIKDMGVKPEGRTLDRINNDGNYGPENCRWATHHEQNTNKTHAKFRNVTKFKVGEEPRFFGKWEFIGEVEKRYPLGTKRDFNSYRVFKVYCECGSIEWARKNDLFRGKSLQCQACSVENIHAYRRKDKKA